MSDTLNIWQNRAMFFSDFYKIFIRNKAEIWRSSRLLSWMFFTIFSRSVLLRDSKMSSLFGDTLSRCLG